MSETRGENIKQLSCERHRLVILETFTKLAYGDTFAGTNFYVFHFGKSLFRETYF